MQWNFVDRVVLGREKAGANSDGSLLDIAISARKNGQLNDRELRHLLMVLFAGGYDTTKNILTMTMHLMLDRGFGRGAHMCLGQHLVRTQLEEAIHLIAQRLVQPRRVGQVKWRPFLGSWGPSSLPIEFATA